MATATLAGVHEAKAKAADRALAGRSTRGVRTAMVGHDENRSLRRLSLLVALVCVTCDTVPLAWSFAERPGSAVLVAVLAVVVLADLALALPARTAGAVAILHGAVRFGATAALATLPASDGPEVGNASGLVVAAFRAGAWAEGRYAAAALAALVLGVAGEQAVRGFSVGIYLGLEPLSNTMLPWLVGRYTSSRRGYVAELKQQAEAERRAADEAVEQALTRERGLIARDLHDTISHHVSAMGMQAGAARLGLDPGSAPAGLVPALRQVETSSRAAMGDLRRMLDLLHGTERDDVAQPGLGHVEDLVDGIRATGTEVRLEVARVDPTRLPGSLDVAVYRILQEMLTNALRHGAGDLVDLGIRQTTERLTVYCDNPVAPVGGPAGPDPAARQRGLAGIRHRAGLFGGTVSHGLRPDGRTWRTRVVFPLPSTVAGSDAGGGGS